MMLSYIQIKMMVGLTSSESCCMTGDCRDKSALWLDCDNDYKILQYYLFCIECFTANRVGPCTLAGTTPHYNGAPILRTNLIVEGKVCMVLAENKWRERSKRAYRGCGSEVKYAWYSSNIQVLISFILSESSLRCKAPNCLHHTVTPGDIPVNSSWWTRGFIFFQLLR